MPRPPIIPPTYSSGLKHREERVVGGELNTSSAYDVDKEDTDPEVLYDRVSVGSIGHCSHCQVELLISLRAFGVVSI